MSTISGVLMPPYPHGFFSYHYLDEYFEYQNGGQWDWYGARIILGMYLHEFMGATGELEKIASKAINNCGLFEWDTVESLAISESGSQYLSS